MVSEVKKYITSIGYFGPSTNVRDVREGAPSLDSMMASLASLPKRESAENASSVSVTIKATRTGVTFNSAVTNAIHDRPGVVLSFKRAGDRS